MLGLAETGVTVHLMDAGSWATTMDETLRWLALHNRSRAAAPDCGRSVAGERRGDDGVVRWQRSLPAGPRTVSVAGSRVLTTDNGGEIRTFSLATGAPGWVAQEDGTSRPGPG